MQYVVSGTCLKNASKSEEASAGWIVNGFSCHERRSVEVMGEWLGRRGSTQGEEGECREWRLGRGEASEATGVKS
jgi:hypothetical protein